MVLETTLNKMKEERKSIIKEALIDMKDIQQAADANAKKRLAEDFPREFGNILKEELNKNKSAKESNVDGAERNKEYDMKNLTKGPLKVVKETVGSGKPFDQKAKGAKKIEEEREKDFMADIEGQTPNQGKGEAAKGKIYNVKLVGPTSGKPIANTKKGVSENVNLSELDQTGANQSLDGAQPMDELLTMEQIEEEIANMGNMAEELQGVSASAGQGQYQDQGAQEGGIPYNELVEMRDKLDKMIQGSGMNEMHQGNFSTATINKMHQGDYDTSLIDEANPPQDNAFPPTKMKTGKNPNNNIYRGNEPKGVDEDVNPPQDKAFPPTKMKTGKNPNNNIYRGNEPKGVNEANPPQDNAFPPTKMKTGKNPNNNIYRGNEPKGVDEMHQGNFSTATINKMHQGDYDTALIDEYGDAMEITEEDINSVLGANETPVEESHGLTNRKNITGRHMPSPEHLSTAERNRLPYALQQQNESKKKIGSLIEENKKLTKKLNETKKYKETASKLVEGYQTVIGKYRSQLKEMAVFNTNLSHVNNLLVNEELALTQEDKVKIINEFKKVDSIVSSVNVYKNLMTEMKVGKKTLTESFENKVSASIQPSSKQKLDEVKEKTAYSDDKHIQRMKAIIESMEKRGKKII